MSPGLLSHAPPYAIAPGTSPSTMTMQRIRLIILFLTIIFTSYQPAILMVPSPLRIYSISSSV